MNVVVVVGVPTNDPNDRRIRAWLLALLRYAITLDDEDRLAALAAASAIDTSDPRRSGDFQFFHRTSARLCEAVANPVRGNMDVVRCHLNRMSDERMKRAFAAALDLDRTVALPTAKAVRGSQRYGLWEGLKPGPAHQSLNIKKNI